MNLSIFVLTIKSFVNMIEITEISEFLSLLESTEIEHDNYHFNFQEIPANVNIAKITIKNIFKNCKFEGKRIDFLDLRINNTNHEHILNFDNCEILSNIYFKDCFLNELTFTNSDKEIKDIYITPTEILYLKICGNKGRIKQNINFTINDTKIIKYFYCDFINSTGNFYFVRVETMYFRFNNNNISNLNIENSNFTKGLSLGNCKINNSYIKNNSITEGYFENTDFGTDGIFEKNDFNKGTNFTKVKNLNKTNVEFKNCNFFEKAYFNNSQLYCLKIIDCKFSDISSFQDSHFLYFEIDRNLFDKNAYFDNIKIEFVNSCNIKTLRTIKQQLKNTDNTIDYDKFRIYELNSYKAELLKKSNIENKTNKKISIFLDYLILLIGDFYSLNGRNWLRAAFMTLLSAFFFYSIFFILENLNYKLYFPNYNQFLTGYFRYLVVTDYYNPLINGKEYIENFYSWIPFLLGKIFIAIGIYETIISFRKFKK